MSTELQTIHWIKLATIEEEFDFGDNKLTEIEVEGKRICVAKTSTDLKACAAKCPHAGGKMADGKLDKNQNIVCPVHSYSFDLKTGRDRCGEGYHLKTYEIKEQKDGFYIGI